MIIEKIEIKNFRALKDISLNCNESTIILGKNGAGKSSLLYALDAFYNVAFKPTEYDFYNRDQTLEIEIKVTFSGLNELEVSEFKSQITNNQLIVTKKVDMNGSKYYGAARKFPAFTGIRQLGALDKKNKLNELITNEELHGVSQKATSGANADQIMNDFESQNEALLSVVQSQQQFFGPKNIGGGKLDKFTKFVLIPAVKDASSESDKKGVIMQLIDVLVMRSVNKRADVIALNNEFEARVKDVYKDSNITELKLLAQTISELLSRYAPGASFDLNFGEVVPPKIPLPPALASLVEDEFKCPIEYTGHGLQRALIFALLQQLSITDLSPESDVSVDEEGDPNSEAVLDPSPDLILGIEEPELYQHPSRSRYLSKMLDNLVSDIETQNEAGNQVILATHSPQFISMDKFSNLRMARKYEKDSGEPNQSEFFEYSLNDAASRLADVTGRNHDEFTAESFTARTLPVMNGITNEGFFADLVVVVEGLSDVAILWAMQEILGLMWDEKGIVLVPVGGKNNIDRPVVIFEGLGIPCYFIFDGDIKNKGSSDEQKTINSNRILQRLAGVSEVDFPSSQVKNTFANFEQDIETTIKQVNPEKFESIRNEVSEELGFGKPSSILKNQYCATTFITKFYDDGNTVPLLEEIVINITDQYTQST